jgi:transposase
MLSFCGIDVSKDRLDVMVLPDEYSSSVPNDPAGWAILVEQLRGFSITAIGIEASGGYERGAVRSLQAAGMPVRQVNPFKLAHALALLRPRRERPRRRAAERG